MTLRTDAVCRACGAPIAWRRTWADKPMPIDPEPHPRGNLVVTGRTATVLANAVELRGRRHVGALYRSHYATCPLGHIFRKR